MKAEDRLGKGLYVLQPVCSAGPGRLATISLNYFLPVGAGESAFYPKARQASTEDGNLSVRREGNTLIAQKTGIHLFEGARVRNYRFTYAPSKKGAVYRLTGFSDNFEMKARAIEYIAPPKKKQIVRLDCGALLPGLDPLKFPSPEK